MILLNQDFQTIRQSVARQLSLLCANIFSMKCQKKNTR
jgi:hypothetical protein